MRVNTVLFDFDGTLADTLPVCFEAFREIFLHYDQRMVTDADIVSMFGPPEAGIVRLQLADRERVEEAIEAFYASYEKAHERLCRPSPQILELLRSLRNSGLRIGVVTGKARRSFDISVAKLGLGDLFDVSITGDDVVLPKPHPEGIWKALSLLGTAPGEALYAGDSEADIRAGKQAGVTTIGVHWFDEVQTREFAVKPDALFTRPGELLEYVLRMHRKA